MDCIFFEHFIGQMLKPSINKMDYGVRKLFEIQPYGHLEARTLCRITLIYKIKEQNKKARKIKEENKKTIKEGKIANQRMQQQ